jgi:ATP-dependent DNA helicase RecG
VTARERRRPQVPRTTLLDRPIQYLKGVGPRRAELFHRLGIVRVRDLLYHAPRRYLDATAVTPIAKLRPGMEASAVGRVVSKGVLPTRSGLRIFQAVIRDRTGLIECAWPGQPFLDRTIRAGDLLLVTGPVRFFHGRQIQPREYLVLAREDEEAGDPDRGQVIPIYPATENLTHRQIRKLIDQNWAALLAAVGQEEDPLPAEVRARHGLPGLPEAFEGLHRPRNLADVERARRRFAFEEAFVLQILFAQARRRRLEARPGIAFERKQTLVRALAERLPFPLTGAQKRALREIGTDMAAPRPMNRLLQGDVGSGKTVVALFAMLRAVENGYQAALMAPTELLAEQHDRTVRGLLGDLPVRVELLKGGLRGAEREAALERIATGAAQIVIGTHALIQEDVRFARLGLAVIDEQHRFGVRQRLRLREAGRAPDVLVMSATPIPRSLALTLYGDLDVSVLDEMPPGRRPVVTAVRPASARADVFRFVAEHLRAGRQAYVVYPLIEDSEALDTRAATEEYERLRTEVFPEFRVGLVHGRMPADEKESVMRRFVAGELDVLVSTAVIEVGIDVPNATVMVVEGAERFGLSQLHQLRGRVGRGAEQSYCVVLYDGPEPPERLEIFARTTDGFEIARQDLRLRGAGEIFGLRQAGFPEFRFLDLSAHDDLLLGARDEAARTVADDPELARPEHRALRAVLRERYGDRLALYEVG